MGDLIPKDVRDQIDFELDVIKRMGYPGYLLIVQDYVAAARRMGVAVGPGRGLERLGVDCHKSYAAAETVLVTERSKR